MTGRRKLTLPELRERQLAILDAVGAHCDKHAITFYLCAGTLLGAVRHEGYIPWDDDIDLMFPRPDYERFCATFGADAAPSSQLSLRSLATSPSYGFPFAKVCDDTTEIDVESDVVRGIGVYVDIFPLDGWYDGRAARTIQRTLIQVLDTAMRVKHLSRRRERGSLRNVTLAAAKLALAAVSPRAISRAIEWAARRAPFQRSADVGVAVWGYHEVVPRRFYGRPAPVTFEGRPAPGPEDADGVLRAIYGNYMTLPPADQQVTNHRFVAYALD